MDCVLDAAGFVERGNGYILKVLSVRNAHGSTCRRDGAGAGMCFKPQKKG